MSWWDTTNITNLASQALKNAQKKIDKVLDIENDNTTTKGHGQKQKDVVVKTNEQDEKSDEKGPDGDFWSTWMSSGDKKTKDEKETTDQHSSWNLPWNTVSSSSEKLPDYKKADNELSFTNSELQRDSQGTDTVDTNFHISLDEELNSVSGILSNKSAEVQESDSFTSDWQDFSIEDSFTKKHVSEKTKHIELTVENINDSVQLSVPYQSSSIISLVEKDSEKTEDSVLQTEVEFVKTTSENFATQEKSLEVVVQHVYNTNKSDVSTNVFIDQNAALFEDAADDMPRALHEEPSSASSIRSDPTCSSNINSECEKLLVISHELNPNKKDDAPLDNTLQSLSTVSDIENISELEAIENIQNTFQPENTEDQKSPKDFMDDYVSVCTMNDAGQALSYAGSTAGSDDLLNINSDMDMGNSRTSSDLDLLGGHASSTGSSDTSKLDSSIDTVVDQIIIDSHSDTELTDKDSSFSAFIESSKECDFSDTPGTIDDSTHSLSSSYVTCMIEEAMEDFSKTEDSGSDNHSNGEKSESSKVDSELEKSIYSGHESSDEIETTTSSDIEIITAPGSNGENKYNSSFDLSPLKIALQRSVREHGNNHSDSQSSSSANSKGELDRLSPERGEASHWKDYDFHPHDMHSLRDDSANSPYHPERLLKLSKLVLQHRVLGGQKLAEMAEVLQARENKLVQLSKDNHQLMEDNNILRCQLQQSEESRLAETADLTALTDEFTARLSEAEKKLQTVLKEKESLKQKLVLIEKELEKSVGNSDLQALLNEKQEQVVQLLAEGEKLSKQQLQSSNIIKKLRAKEKENDNTIAHQKKKIEDLTKEVEKLTAVLDSREELEKKQSEAISQLTSAVQRQDKELVKLKSDLEDSQEKTRGLQSALDNSYKEIAELHKSNATQDSKAQEAALSAETLVREELKAAMEREQQKFRQEREAFIIQIDDLRLEMSRLEKEHSRREDILRQEITHLQEGLQLNEARSQDLTQCITSATRPLLRQIENLQATYVAQSSAWEKVEKTLTERLADSQNALALAQEKEQTAAEQLLELTAKVTSLEAANSRLKQEKYQLTAQIENIKSQLEDLQDSQNSISVQLETNRQKLSQEVNQLKMDKIHLESQLTVEQTKLDTERKKIVAMEEQLRLAQERPRSHETPSPSSSVSISRNNSMIGSMSEGQSNSFLHWSFHEDSDNNSTIGSTSKTSVYDSLRQSGAAVVVENLSSQLKLKEGEITQLQSEIGQLERTRESMARELVNLSNQIDELSEIKEAHRILQENFNELNGRYSAILQMYGEKEEQVQELKLDLQDVKEMYKSQIDALLAK
ncbi:TATA element modulatory factor 1 [Bulinus truncatus]|nr:TATA element modulatory factor 1 [Bulinus truncatus]